MATKKKQPKVKIQSCSKAGHFLNPHVKANKSVKSAAGSKLALC